MTSPSPTAHSPRSLADNPFHRLNAKFARSRAGSFEILFTIESLLTRWSWAGLLALFALVLPPFEVVDYVSTVVRLATLVYPCFFIWALTRFSGVELLQLVLEGHWTGELAAAPLTNRDWVDGFITPVWATVRHYVLISAFSLALYGLETHVIYIRPGEGRPGAEGYLYLEDWILTTVLFLEVYGIVIAWIVLVYLGRLFAEIRLRNDLIKGLATLVMLMGGLSIIALYWVLFRYYGELLTRTPTLAGLGAMFIAIAAGCGWLHRLLLTNFRHYLTSQIGIDRIVYDEQDPRATAWFVPHPGEHAAPSNRPQTEMFP